MTSPKNTLSNQEMLDECDVIRQRLYAAIDTLRESLPSNRSTDYFLQKMMDMVANSWNDLGLLRIYDAMLVDQRSVFRLHHFHFAVTAFRSFHKGSLPPEFTADYVDRAVAFEHSQQDVNDLFGELEYKEYREYLEAIRSAAIMSETEVFAYLTSHLSEVARITVTNDITDPKMLSEMIKIMSSTPSLAGGAL